MVRNQDRLSWTIRCIISKYFENYDFFYWFRILNNAFSLFLTFHLSISTFRMAPKTTRQRWDLWEVLWLNLWCIATPWQTVQMLCMSVDLNVIHISTNRCLIVWTKEWVKRWPGWRGGRGMDFQAYIHPAGQYLYHPQNPLYNLYETGLSSASSIGTLWWKNPWRSLYKCN